MTKDQNHLSDKQESAAHPAAETELDATGLYCPEPVMLLHNKIRDIADGSLLRLHATDPSTTRDVPKFCLYLGHELLESGQSGDQYFYLIKKKAES